MLHKQYRLSTNIKFKQLMALFPHFQAAHSIPLLRCNIITQANVCFKPSRATGFSPNPLTAHGTSLIHFELLVSLFAQPKCNLRVHHGDHFTAFSYLFFLQAHFAAQAHAHTGAAYIISDTQILMQLSERCLKCTAAAILLVHRSGASRKHRTDELKIDFYIATINAASHSLSWKSFPFTAGTSG